MLNMNINESMLLKYYIIKDEILIKELDNIKNKLKKYEKMVLDFAIKHGAIGYKLFYDKYNLNNVCFIYNDATRNEMKSHDKKLKIEYYKNCNYNDIEGKYVYGYGSSKDIHQAFIRKTNKKLYNLLNLPLDNNDISFLTLYKLFFNSEENTFKNVSVFENDGIYYAITNVKINDKLINPITFEEFNIAYNVYKGKCNE